MRVAFATLLLLAAALAGCASGDGDKGDGPSASASATASGSASASGTGAPTVPANVTFTADVQNGTAPLAVNFTINATTGATAWRLSYGDGGQANGTSLPAVVNYTYQVGGNFSANLTVAFPSANLTRTLNITVTLEDAKAKPDVLTFTFADSAGCAGDAGADKCITYNLGPDGNGIDGYWQALDERYWGLSFTSTVDQVQPAVADSDCAFTDAAHAIIGNANNSDKPCTGVVPEGTAFIFLYPYALPALEMTLTFTA